MRVTIAGQSYPHLLFQLILSHPEWRYAEVAAGGGAPAANSNNLWGKSRLL